MREEDQVLWLAAQFIIAEDVPRIRNKIDHFVLEVAPCIFVHNKLAHAYKIRRTEHVQREGECFAGSKRGLDQLDVTCCALKAAAATEQEHYD